MQATNTKIQQKKKKINFYGINSEIDKYITNARNLGDWELIAQTTGTQVANIDFSKYNEIKFIASYTVEFSNGEKADRVRELTLTSDYIINRDMDDRHILLGSNSGSWFYLWLYLTRNSVQIGNAYDGGTIVKNDTKLYVYAH